MKCTNSIMIKKMNKKPKEIVSDCAALLFLENKPENKPSLAVPLESCAVCVAMSVFAAFIAACSHRMQLV